MDKTYSVENVVLVGGGAYLFRKAIRRHFSKHKIHEVDDPLHANVRGFQLLGEQFVMERPELFAGASAAPAEPSIEPAGS
jgi:plasmid segregation protein ParM